MKRLSIVAIIVFWASFALAAENSGARQVDSPEAAPGDSVRMKAENLSMARLDPNGGLDFPMDLQDAIQVDNNLLARSENRHDAAPMPRDANRAAWGAGSLFITGSITDGHTSVPESSTLLLLGLTLIGLSGYGGRKRFKR